MNVDTEIRKLTAGILFKLCDILEERNSWVELMGVIPRNLRLECYECELNVDNPSKYTTEHIHKIQQASELQKRRGSEILFEEWGTSGKIRPRLGHLLYLLKVAQLFWAADYIADLLKVARPDRPTSGPAARVDTTLETSSDNTLIHNLNEMNYPSSLLSQININPPKIIINNPENTQPLEKNTNSNLIQFSASENIPDLDELLADSSHNPEIPAFSQLLPVNTSEIPCFSQILEEQHSYLPRSDVLVPEAIKTRDNSPSSTRTCGSPLPNLSLNTDLPHFAYADLESRTGNFDEADLSLGGRKLGSGAFGSVYLASGLTKTPVAVKKLFLNGVEVVNTDDTITKQFRNEVEVLRKYKHENLLALLGYSCDGPTYCLVYEFICGGSLKDNLQNGSLPWIDRLKIATGTASAISYLHNGYKTPLVHRDIKSANILLDGLNSPKLCDFGLIKLAPCGTTNKSTTIFGTSAYMAPEAFRGDVSDKLDIFSFGVVLLELLTGLLPFDENRDGHDLWTHVQEQRNFQTLLDDKAGNWRNEDMNFGERLFTLAKQCLEHAKSHRPPMCDVVVQLSLITEDAHK